MNTIRNLALSVAASLLSTAALAAPSGGSTSTANVVVTNTAVNPVKTEIVASTILPTIELNRAGHVTFECTVAIGGVVNTCFQTKSVAAPAGKLLRIDEISGDFHAHENDVRTSVRLNVIPPGFVGGVTPSITVSGTPQLSTGAGAPNKTYFQKSTAVLVKTISSAVAVTSRIPTAGVNSMTLHVFYTVVGEGG